VALLSSCGVGGRRDKADERLAEGVREGLRDGLGTGGVDGGGRVAVLGPHRRPLGRGEGIGLIKTDLFGRGLIEESRRVTKTPINPNPPPPPKKKKKTAQ